MKCDTRSLTDTRRDVYPLDRRWRSISLASAAVEALGNVGDDDESDDEDEDVVEDAELPWRVVAAVSALVLVLVLVPVPLLLLLSYAAAVGGLPASSAGGMLI